MWAQSPSNNVSYKKNYGLIEKVYDLPKIKLFDLLWIKIFSSKLKFFPIYYYFLIEGVNDLQYSYTVIDTCTQFTLCIMPPKFSSYPPHPHQSTLLNCNIACTVHVSFCAFPPHSLLYSPASEWDFTFIFFYLAYLFNMMSSNFIQGATMMTTSPFLKDE